MQLPISHHYDYAIIRNSPPVGFFKRNLKTFYFAAAFLFLNL